MQPTEPTSEHPEEGQRAGSTRRRDDHYADYLEERLRSLRDALRVARQGDFTVRLPTEGAEEAMVVEVDLAFNALLEEHEALVRELDRVARTVAVEGKATNATLGPVGGAWASAVGTVNMLVDVPAWQMHEATRVLEAVAAGDLSQTMPLHIDGRPLEGELARLGTTLNSVVAILHRVASDVSRVIREVGIEGRLGAKTRVENLSGTWKELVGDVDVLAANLTDYMRDMTHVSTAIADGDLSQKITVEPRGEILELKNALNATVDQMRSFSAEVIRVAREVGTEGKLGAQADARGVSGVWQELTDSVNRLAGTLTSQVRNIAGIATAIANGDLSQKITVEARGEILELKDAVNVKIDHLRAFTAEVTRVAHEVGTEGRLGAQANANGVSGTWKGLTDSVNLLAGNLTDQVRNIALVTTAIANGDLSKKITVEAKGEILELKNTINATVDRLQTFAAEVTRVAKEVGTEGALGGQADVKGVSGTWKDLTDNVNVMASNLTGQVRGIAKVVTAVATGDLSQKFIVEAKGEIAALADTINNMTEQLRTFAAEVTRVAKEVATEGKLGGQADVKGASGTWKDLTDNVNLLAGNLTSQVRNIASVTTAVANGDLSKKITVEVKGEVAELKNTINAMVDQLRTFAREVTRVAREVGTEGRLGGQAHVPGVAGTWQELTESVNLMAGNLTSQVRGIARVVTAVAEGDLGQKLVLEVRGELASLADTINDMTDTLRTFADQVTTVAREVGIEGKLGGQARVPGAAGTWRDLTDSVNVLAGNLTNQVRNIALVTTAVARGDLSRKITVEAKGEILELKDTVNAMVEQLRTFAAEVTRVAREVGIDGQLGGQARVPGLSGTWQDLTDSVNLMASNLTDQVRGISKIVTAVASGELTRRLQLVAKGEIATLAETINNMTDNLRTFAEQVTTVAREVGIEGKLGGQAKVPGASGTWRDLTDNVNQLAANLTTQVRAIFEVATAVLQGDLTRNITVGAQGEVLGLKDTINQMIANLRDTTRTNKEQDWLKTNLARFFGIMQGQRDLQSLTDLIMSELTPAIGAQHGAFFLVEPDHEALTLKLTSTYAYHRRKHLSNRFTLGEGIVGQCALERKPISVTEVPDDYVHITSGLGEAPPRHLAVIPVLFENQVRGVIELGSFNEFTPIKLTFLEQLSLNIGLAMNLIGASMRTEQLVQQLQSSNVEIEQRRKEIEDRAQLLEVRNREIAQFSASLEAKTQELARVSSYKSQFLTNMSHEIRTPLNSMMILAQMLAADEDKNLSPKQHEWADTIHASGRDLLVLINQILDLSKVEAGRIETHIEACPLDELREFVERTFRPVAMMKNLDLNIEIGTAAPAQVTTDRQLLQQILKNLMANAFKFTVRGRVELRIELAPQGLTYRNESLTHAPAIIAFAVSDTGIGIPADRQDRIFEAFQQADTSITRQYGGTGLGLTISREYARVLGGEIALSSTQGVGSTFTLYLPLQPIALTQPAPPAAATETWTPAMLVEAPAMRPVAPARPAEAPARPAEAPAQPAEAPARPAEAPVQPAEAPARPAAAPMSPDETKALEGKKVLVIEDDVRNLYATTALLERYHMTIIAVPNARDGFEALNQNPDMDLVLMDIMMPEIDGYQATRHIRAMKEHATLPVIAVTAKASGGDRTLALEAGCNDFVIKPLEIRQLVATMIKNLRR